MNWQNDLFTVKCNKCGSANVEIIPNGYGGEILIYCEDCDNEKDI